MVTELRVYFEGHRALRPGFHRFFRQIVQAAREHRCRVELIACRAKAVSDFTKALQAHPNAWNILLIDGEGPDDGKLYQRLMQRSDWQPPSASAELRPSVYWMVQVMEAWFLADVGALESYYGRGFRKAALGAGSAVEAVPKERAFSRLKEATTGTAKGAYHKTKHAPAIPASINPEKVQQAAPNCKRLFDTVAAKLAD